MTELFGYKRLKEYLETSNDIPRGKGLLEHVDRWRGQAEINDDLTIFEIWCEQAL